MIVNLNLLVDDFGDISIGSLTREIVLVQRELEFSCLGYQITLTQNMENSNSR